MARFPLAFATIVLTLATASAVRAADSPAERPAYLDSSFELEPSDLDQIIAAVLKDHPVLSSSPGIKAAYANRGMPRSEVAQVIFHPHAESRGVKFAFEVTCNRDDPERPWSCPFVELRRYVKLDSQEFEVRVKGDIDLAGLLAITEATRPVAVSAVADTSAVSTVMTVFPANGGYLTSWGTEMEGSAVIVEAHLHHGGDRADPADWEAFVHLFPE